MANRFEQKPDNENGEEAELSLAENHLKKLPRKERELVLPIIEKIGELSEGQQRVIYAVLMEKREAKAESAEKLTSRVTEVRDFFKGQQGSVQFRSSCRDVDILPTREEFIDLVNGDGPVFAHYMEIRKHYENIDEILTKLGY